MKEERNQYRRPNSSAFRRAPVCSCSPASAGCAGSAAAVRSRSDTLPPLASQTAHGCAATALHYAPTFREEQKHWRLGLTWVAGVDEVGRGAWAGPIVAAAVVFAPGSRKILGVRDSKQLSPAQRAEIFSDIISAAHTWGVGVVAAEVIDRIGIAEANRRAMRQAIGSLGCDIDYALIDGYSCRTHIPHSAIVRGDATVHSISAASVVAKVWRDHLMCGMHKEFAQYGFDAHKGYGTAAHERAIREYGMCSIHRRSFVPARCLK